MLKKRYLKSILVIALMGTTLFPISLVQAYSPPPPIPCYHRHRHHPHYRGHYDRDNTWQVLAALGLFGIYYNNTHRSNDYVVEDYNTHRARFISSLDDDELDLYQRILTLDSGKYALRYDKAVNARRIKKLCRNLPNDFNYLGIDESKMIIYIEIL